MEKDLLNLGAEWERLNKEYDDHIRSLFNGTMLAPEKISQLESMQKELFELENLLFKIAKGDG